MACVRKVKKIHIAVVFQAPDDTLTYEKTQGEDRHLETLEKFQPIILKQNVFTVNSVRASMTNGPNFSNPI